MESTSPVLNISKLLFPYKAKTLPNSYIQVTIFMFVKLLVRQGWWMLLEWNGWEYEQKAGDCQTSLGTLIAITHSATLLLPLTALLLSHPTKKPSASVKDSSDLWNWKAWTIISWCQSYMIQDAIWLLYGTYDPSTMTVNPTSDDIVFLLHHFATTSVMATAKGVQGGHYSAMILMWFGEITNPIHNTYEIVKTAVKIHPGPRVEAALPILGKAFAVTYSFVRIVLGPVVTLWLVYHLVLTKDGRKNVGLVLGILWSAMVIAVVHGSLGFAFDYALKAW